MSWKISVHYTEVRFVSFLSGGFITAILVNPSETKLAKTHLCEVAWCEFHHANTFLYRNNPMLLLGTLMHACTIIRV